LFDVLGDEVDMFLGIKLVPGKDDYMREGIECAWIFLGVIDHRWIILSTFTFKRELAVPEGISLCEDLTHESRFLYISGTTENPSIL
jgi:hypothetical protein